jgi:hypothetical protein
MGELFRIPPQGPAAAYQTYQVHQSRDTVVVDACEAAGCQSWLHGWETTVDERTDLGLAQATYIRQKSARTFTERRTGDGITVFRFEPRQRCFAEHRTRPQHYLRLAGDWRGFGDRYFHTRPDDFVEDFAEHQLKIKTQLEKG